MGKYTVQAGQNLFDIALHLYGSIEGIIDLMMSNISLSLVNTLKAGDELEFTNGFVINPDIVTYYRTNSIVPANGERRVYYKSSSLQNVFKIHLNSVQTSAGFTVSGNGDMEIDWGDNSPLQSVTLHNELQALFHSFDNAVPKHRNITVYGDFTLKQLDFTDLQAAAIFLFRPLPVEKFTVKNARLDIGFVALLKDVYEVNLSGLKTASLLPLLENKNLMRLDLSDINVLPETLDEYLLALVKKHYGHRSCTVTLTEYPSGEYKELGRDENGNYLLTCGMEAVRILVNEPAWNESGFWKFIINGTVYSSEIPNS
jgi:hypothetical protein